MLLHKLCSIIKAKLKSNYFHITYKLFSESKPITHTITNYEKGKKTHGFGRRRGLNLVLDFVTEESGNVPFESFFAHFGDVSSSGNDVRRRRNA